MKKTAIFFLTATIFCSLFHFRAAASDFNSYEFFPPSVGVPTTVTGILCQERGYVWLSSLEGVARMDNYQQHLYLYDPANPRSIPSSSVYQVVSDKADNVWVMTERGVARYVSATDDFDRLGFTAFCACADGFGCYFGQLDTLRKFDYQKGEVTYVRPLSSERPFKIDKILPWTSSRFLLFSKDRGLLIYDPGTDTVLAPPVSLGQSKEIFVDTQFRVFVANASGGFDIYASNFDLLNSYSTSNSDLISNYVTSFAELDGKIFIGTLHGLSIYYPDTDSFTSMSHELPGTYSLPVNSIISLATDKAGTIYAGRAKGGVLTISRTFATEYDIVDAGNSQLCPDGLNDIEQFGADRRIWCATDGSGIASYDPDTETFRKYPQTGNMKPVSLARLPDGKILFFNFPERFCTFDPSSGAVQPFTFGNPILDKVNQGITYESIQGKDNTIFLSSGHSLYAYDSVKKEVHTVSIPAGTTSNSRIISCSGNSITQFFNNSRYLFKYDPLSYNLTVLYDIGPDVRIYSSAFDGGEHVWIATEEGLADFNVWSNSYELIKNDFIRGARGVIVDSSGKVWVSTIYGVFVYNPSTKIFHRLGPVDGISASSGFNPKPCLLSSDGDVYLAGSTHLVRIDPGFTIRSQSKPRVVLESVSVDGRNLSDLSHVRIGSTTSDVVFKVFVNEDFIRSFKLYRFKLVSKEGEVEFNRLEPVLEFSSCLPGKYHLLVSCSTGNCEWSEWADVCEFKVRTLWYESWWFFAICLILAIAAFGYLYYFKFSDTSVKKNSSVPSATKEDLDRLNALINLSHDLRTPLTLIMGPLENVLNELKEGDPNEKRLRGIYKQAARMKSILNDFFAGENADSVVPETPEKEKETSALRPATLEQQTVPQVAPDVAAKVAANAPSVPDQVGIAKERLETAALSSLLPTKEEFTSAVELKDATILLVEDDIELRNYVKDELSDDVKQVFVASNGVEAIEVLNRQNIDIVVSDVMMPEMDGFALCRYIKTTVAISHIPVILLTARTDENSRLLGYKNGADDYITKPFEMNYLKVAITNLFLSRALVRKRYTAGGEIPDSRETTFSSADENFMNAFEKLVRDNISNAELDMRMLVEGMNMSRTVLYNKVKQLTGMNLQNYVNKCRMEYVIQMMRTSDLPLAEIAEQSGFNSPRYFSTSFKNYTGMTPSQYKKEVIDAEKK